jgi:radical SAM superfamily enzyme YgiQ (UPF0313 family)
VKVLLINPLRENEIIGNNPSIIEEERGCNPFLGLLCIGGYLEKYADHDIAIIDSQVEKLSYSSLASRISLLKPNVVGLTAMTLTLIDVIKTINIVKELDKNTKIVLGGPHVHLFPNETIKLQNVDYLVLWRRRRGFQGTDGAYR